MAISIEAKQVATAEERTWRINIETAKGSDPVITAFREAVLVDDTGEILSRKPVGEVRRGLTSVAAESVTAAGVTVTMAQLAAIIAATADKWREEDLAAVAANPVQVGRAARPISR